VGGVDSGEVEAENNNEFACIALHVSDKSDAVLQHDQLGRVREILAHDSISWGVRDGWLRTMRVAKRQGDLRSATHVSRQRDRRADQMSEKEVTHHSHSRPRSSLRYTYRPAKAVKLSG